MKMKNSIYTVVNQKTVKVGVDSFLGHSQMSGRFGSEHFRPF